MGSANGPAGHRQRLRERFLADESLSHTDEALLELLLTYSIPQRDVQLLAKALLAISFALYAARGRTFSGSS
jgi:DNA repair protein RadC